MAFISDEVFDQGLDYADTNGTKMDICSSEPANYAGIAAVTLGNAAVNTAAPEAGAVDGRRVIIPAITAGTVTASGTATYWALSNGSSVLIAADTLSTSQAVIDGNTFTLDATSITLRDPA